MFSPLLRKTHFVFTFLNFSWRSFTWKQFFLLHTLFVVYLECKCMIYHFITTFFSTVQERVEGRRSENVTHGSRTTKFSQTCNFLVRKYLFNFVDFHELQDKVNETYHGKGRGGEANWNNFNWINAKIKKFSFVLISY